MGHGYNPSHGQPFNSPSYGQSYNPSFGQVPQQTILLPSSQPYKPGIGQIAKEAFVFAGVSAGVNAAVNRILPGGIYGHSGGGGGGGGGVSSAGVIPATSHTQITYNNYYNNQSVPTPNAGESQPVPAQPAANPPAAENPASVPSSVEPPAVNPLQNTETNASPDTNNKPNNQNTPESSNNPNPLGFVTSNEDIKKLSEKLFSQDENNAFKHITIKLQGQKKDDSVTDDASDP